MWLLTCDGGFLGGKRIWLRPGTTHLLGRTKYKPEGGERYQHIDDKTISRKHLTIEVSSVDTGDSSTLHTRSTIKLVDASRVGTTVNDEQIKDQTKTLEGKNYAIKLGHYEHLLHLTWHTVVLSLASLPKKAKDDALAARRKQLKQTDVKLISDYIPNETTHVISKKRNNPSALQALVQSRWLVTDAFVDSLAAAITPDETREDNASPLEQDFDANWPKEERFLVPAAGEPVPRPDSFLKPSAARKDIFQDFTFVFLAQSQYDNLLPVITVGGGKALLREVDPAESRVEDVVEYVNEIAGHKGSGQFRLSQQTGSGGVVVVRLMERDEAGRQFLTSIDQALDQRSVEQNEFLDAILMADASGLRRLLAVEESNSLVKDNADGRDSRLERQTRTPQEQRAVTVADSPPVEQQPQQSQPVHEEQPALEQQPTEQPSTMAKRRNRRIITQSRFKGFDDFDSSQFAQPVAGSSEPPANDSQAPNLQDMDSDEPSQGPHTQRNPRKRPAPVPESEQEDNMYDSILTGHAAMKRQKTQAAQNGESNTSSKPVGGVVASTAGQGKKKKTKEMDVMAEVQALRQQQEEQRRQDEESLRQGLPEGTDISTLRNLAVVEEMELPVRERPSRNPDAAGASARWDPAWNGRKNFKKFRPQGERRDGPRLQRVMVALEEVPRKGHGIGDEYWLNSSSTNRSKSKSQSQSQRATRADAASRSQRVEDDDDDARFRRLLQKSREDEENEARREEIAPEEVAGNPRSEAIRAAMDAAPSQIFATESQRKAAGKRPAAQQGGGPAKKTRQSRLAPPGREVVSLDDDDDDDGLKFRRRQR